MFIDSRMVGIFFNSETDVDSIEYASKVVFTIAFLFAINLPLSIYQESLVGLEKVHIFSMYEIFLNICFF